MSKLLDNLQAGIETVRNRIASPQAGGETMRNRIASSQAGTEAVRNWIVSPTTNSVSATDSISTTTRITEENANNQLKYYHNYFRHHNHPINIMLIWYCNYFTITELYAVNEVETLAKFRGLTFANDPFNWFCEK